MFRLQFEQHLLSILSICTFVDSHEGLERPGSYTPGA